MARCKNLFVSKEELEEKYEETKSIYKVAKFYNKNYKTIISLMDYYNIKRTVGSQGARKHYYDEDYFEIIDTEDKAYWLGFIMADGCIYKGSDKNSFRLQINLKTDDKILLELFQKCIKSDYKIQDKVLNNKYHVSTVKINSTKMCNDLIKHGVTERKSLICEFPVTVPDNLIHHFIRGYFDGDGCISVSDTDHLRYKFSIVGGKDMLEKIQEYLPGTYLYHLKNRELIVELQTCNIENIRNIFNYLYKDATIFLPRKYNKFCKII